MFRWYVINTYSGHENKVKQNLEHRVHTMGQERNVRQVVVPTEQISEMKDGQRIQTDKRTMPGYVLVQMEMSDDAWTLVKNTPGVTGFVGSRNKPVPLSQPEAKERQRGAVIGFFISCWAELKRVQWPDRETLVQASAITLVFIAVAAAYLGALDALFSFLVKRIL